MPTVSLFCTFCSQRLQNITPLAVANRWHVICPFCRRAVDYEAKELNFPLPPLDVTALLTKTGCDQQKWRDIFERISTLLRQELATLETLGLPLPVTHSYYTWDIKRDNDGLCLHFPLFLLPDNVRSFVVDPLSTPPSDSPTLAEPEKLGFRDAARSFPLRLARTYVVIFPPDNVPKELPTDKMEASIPLPADYERKLSVELHEQYRALFPKKIFRRRAGFEELLRQFPNGRWFNRNPYGFFNLLSIRVRENDPYVKFISQWAVPPLTTVAPLSLADIKAIKHRMQFYDCYVDPATNKWAIRVHKRGFFVDEVLPVGPPDYWTDLKLPNFDYTAPVGRYKILPPPETKPALLIPLFEQLARFVPEPFTFSWVADATSAYLDVCCSERALKQLERQLRLSAPGTILQPLPLFEEVSASYTLVSKRVFTSDAFTRFKTLRDFSLDPLAHLFTVTESLSGEDRIVARIQLAPIPDATINQVLAFYRSKIEWITGYMAWKKERKEAVEEEHTERLKKIQSYLAGLQEKMPAFAVTVHLQATSEELYEQLRDNYVYQYNNQSEDASRYWVEEREEIYQSPIERAHELGTNLPKLQWQMLSLPELVALLHFPTPEAQADHFEYSSGYVADVPPTYTEPA